MVAGTVRSLLRIIAGGREVIVSPDSDSHDSMVRCDWLAGDFDNSVCFETPSRGYKPLDDTAILVARSSWTLSGLALRLFSSAWILRRSVSRYPFATVGFILLRGCSLWNYHHRSGSKTRSYPGIFIYTLDVLAPWLGGSAACLGHRPVVSSLMR